MLLLLEVNVDRSVKWYVLMSEKPISKMSAPFLFQYGTYTCDMESSSSPSVELEVHLIFYSLASSLVIVEGRYSHSEDTDGSFASSSAILCGHLDHPSVEVDFFGRSLKKIQLFDVLIPWIFPSYRSSRQCFSAVCQLPILQATLIFSTSMGCAASLSSFRMAGL